MKKHRLINNSMHNSIHTAFLFSMFALLVLALLSEDAAAANDHLKLLAVSPLSNGTMLGSVADLELEIKSGSGKVFIDTYPLSKLDTQLSIRFAKEIACKFAKVDCSQRDFLYTIRANSQFVGGPSAGAAITVITFAQLKDLDINENVAITGTINSGRLVGNVGGVKAKIEGAANASISKVLIPIGEVNITIEEDRLMAGSLEPELNESVSINDSVNNKSNGTHAINGTKSMPEPKTINMVEYGKGLGVEVIPVSDIEEAIFHFTGVSFKSEATGFDVSEEYQNLMYEISQQLCTRSLEIIRLIKESNLELDNTSYNNEPLNKTYGDALDLLEQSNSSYMTESYYSASSQCYGANIKLYYVFLISQNYSDVYYLERIESLGDAIELYEMNISNIDYNTISDLQTAMIIRQRLEEANEYLAKSDSYFSNITLIEQSNITDEHKKLARERAIFYIALTVERLRTSLSWATLFNMEGKNYEMDSNTLQASCINIIDNAHSLIQYARLYFPGIFHEQESNLRILSSSEDPVYCIAVASKIKAEVNAIVSSFGITEAESTGLVDRKLEKAREVIAEEIINGRFPIMGYSYYEYSKTLREIDTVSSLLYSEYALELSNLDLYFDSSYKTTEIIKIEHKKEPADRRCETFPNWYVLSAIIFGVFFGFVLGAIMSKKHFDKHYNSKRKRLK